MKPHMQQFCIVLSSGRFLAWPGTPEENKKFLCCRALVGTVKAQNEVEALSAWRRGLGVTA